MEAVYPGAASALARGRRRRRPEQRQRHRTTPITFAEIKEVDEDHEQSREVAAGSDASAERRRRQPDQLVELVREFAECRRRRARRAALREPDEQPPEPAGAAISGPGAELARASSEPT